MYVEINESLPQESAEVFKDAGFSDVTVIFDDFSKARFIKADKNLKEIPNFVRYVRKWIKENIQFETIDKNLLIS